MIRRQYDVCMKLPLRKRLGTLTAEISGDTLTGHLDILGHSEPFAGTIDPAGHCAISGRYITRSGAVPFVAEGTLTRSFLHLRVREERRVFEMTGTASPAEEGL